MPFFRADLINFIIYEAVLIYMHYQRERVRTIHFARSPSIQLTIPTRSPRANSS